MEQDPPVAETASNAAMPQSRLNKRPSDDADMSGDGASAQKVKLPRMERGPEDFSTAVKHKLQTYTRTGQACDRCKVCVVVITLEQTNY